MTVRRILLAPLTAVLVAGPLGTTAARASFADSAAPLSLGVGTASVAVPGTVKGGLACDTSISPVSTSTMSASWTRSTAPKVSGYVVTVYFSDDYAETVQLASTVTSWSAPITTYNVTVYKLRYAVTTLTSYGWTAESAPTEWFGC